MGFWFNNFIEFERKRNRENKLILNFYYVGDEGEQNRSVKAFVNKTIKVPTDPMDFFDANGVYRKLPLDFNRFELDSIMKDAPSGVPPNEGKEIFELNIPYFKSLIDQLPKEFYSGDYEKRLKFDGFYPERKVEFDSKLEKLISKNDVIELDSLEGIKFGEFLNLEEWRGLPYVVLDIEKPLWKKDFEKINLKLREKLIKQEKKYSKLSRKKQEQRMRVIKELEKRLTIEVEDIGKIKLYDEKFDSEISFIGTIWGEGNNIIKELYVIDYNDEIDYKKYVGFNVLKFDSEKELISGLKESFHKRKPVISYGHYQVYDFIQLKFAAGKNKLIYDPAVKDVQPRRDFVRSFLQRLKEDLIYLDTMNLTKISSPFLAQRSFGTNFKLEGVARFQGVDFSKSLSHEELRFAEIRRLVGKTKKIRKKAADDLLKYTAGDLDVTRNIAFKLNPLPLLLDMKKVLPYCTVTEIAFATNCMNKIHDYKHFKKTRNLPYIGYKAKERHDQISEFRKAFPKIKRDLLKGVGLNKTYGRHENVSQYYIPLEDWLKDLSFGFEPKLKEIYDNISNEKDDFTFSQYHRAFFRDIFTDYYFSRKNEMFLEEFNLKYGFSVSDLKEGIAKGYGLLASEIKNKGLTYLYQLNDYIFVKGGKELSLAKKVRELDEFCVLGKTKKNPIQLEIFN